jgi:subtilisin family serine protease
VTENEKYKIINNDYFDILIKYGGDLKTLEQYKMYSPQISSDYIATIFLPMSEVGPDIIMRFDYASIPKCYSLCSSESLSASGVLKLRQVPAINLRGSGVLVGIIDTGIDYTNPMFIHKDGTSKVIAIWDQTIDSQDQYPNVRYPTYYGTEYNNEQIIQAIHSENPLLIVPSKDEIGHGTKLAGIAAGNEDEVANFSGVAPDSDLIIVKLKQAKKNLRDFFYLPDDVPCYQENDLMWGIKYLVFKAKELGRPVSICVGLGTSQGAHDYSGHLNMISSIYADIPGVAMSIAAGNEGSLRRHFYSSVDAQSGPISATLHVSEEDKAFSMELWGEPPSIYSIEITSPSGETIKDISNQLSGNREISFLLERVKVYIDYIMIEQESGKQLILLRLQNLGKGEWGIKVGSKGDLPGAFHIWLPSGDFISKNTYFLQSDAFTTITSPGNSVVPICITAYNTDTNSIAIDSSRGFSTSNIINPSLASPGVDLLCPTLDHGFTYLSGTSAAVAHTTGITAMLLEWGIVRNYYPGIDSIGIKKFLMRGAKRNDNDFYPNRDWGYGIIDAFNTFNSLRADIE